MSRGYSPELLDLIDNTSVYRLGIDLAKACINANLPAVYVAQVFEVTRATIHTWFRGGAIRPRKRPRIETFISLVEEDLKKGILALQRTYVTLKSIFEGYGWSSYQVNASR
jgi:hypothetical protein